MSRDNCITDEQAAADYELVKDEPNVAPHLNDFTREDIADIANAIRVFRKSARESDSGSSRPTRRAKSQCPGRPCSRS